MIGILFVAFIAMYFRWMLKQHEYSWAALEDWGHAYAIPGISGWLVWQQRKAILAEKVQPFWPALAPFLLGIMCYLFFVVGVPNHMLQGGSMILTLGSMALLICGTRIFRHLFLPIAYLAFAMTISQQIMERVTFQLQLFASKGAWALLMVIGSMQNFLVDLNGNMLSVGGNNLNVAEACSGMRMVVAFFALAGVIALISCKHWWQRTALMLLAAPIAILMNVIRVAVLGLASLWNINFAAGDAHMMIGTLLLFPSLLLFLAIVWALNKIVDDEPPPELVQPKAVKPA